VQISALGTEDEIFEQVLPAFCCMQGMFSLIDIYLFSAYFHLSSRICPLLFSYFTCALPVLSLKIMFTPD
jgi:hypothetical protein